MLNKILSLLLISVLLVSAGSVEKVYEFSTPEVKGEYTYLEGCRPSMHGFAPAVSVKASRLLLEPGTQAKSVSVEYGNLIEVPGEHFIKPTIPAFQSKGGSSKLTAESIYKDVAARELLAKHYEKDALFPGVNRSNSVYTGFKFGYGIALTVVNPVQYNPVRSKLYYYDKITVSVETEPIDPTREVAARVLTPFRRSLLQFTVDNPEALADLELTPMDADDVELLLITYPTVENGWDDYIALNKRRGFRTKVAMIADVLQTSGSTNQDKIRNYVKKQYEDHKIVFATLGGDVNKIVHRELYSEGYDHNKTPDRFMQKYSGADMYFGTLDGNWNNDGDNKYGEPGEEDMFWDVFVSRIPVDNTTHLANVMKKTLHYSETPKRDQVTNLLLAGEFLWDDYGVTVWGADNLEQFVDYKDEYGWKSYGFPRSIFTLTWLTDKQTGAAYGWDGADLRSKILSSKPAFLHHDGHGNTTFCYAMGANAISSNFTNDGANQNYFVSMSGACNPAQFKVNDCFMERLLHLNKGAVALIANWDNGIADDDGTNAPGGVPFRFFGDALFNPAKRVPFLEAMHAMSKEALVDVSLDPDAINKAPYYGLLRYSSYNTNLLGDPALSIWTATPKDVTANTFNVTADKGKFTMSNTPPYTSVALANTSTDEIITAQITGYKYNADISFVVGDSACSITDDAYKAYAASNSKVKVYIKAHNYIPGSFEVDIDNTGIINSGNVKVLSKNMIQTLNGNTMIRFAVNKNEKVNVSLFNIKGVLVKTLMNDNVTSGVEKLVSFNNSELGSGLYYCKISTNSFQSVKSFIVTK